MSKNSTTEFRRGFHDVLAGRLVEPRRHFQVVAGPRQVGKTTLVRQVLESRDGPCLLVSADEPSLRDSSWLASRWEAARELAREAGDGGAVLAVDEIQKVAAWSEVVKRLWDEDTSRKVPLRVVLLGSSPLLLARGLSETLAGRFEMLRLPHWSYREMRDAFGFSLDEYIYFGGYPGAASLVHDEHRWRRYILDSLVETTISRDILLLARVDKPALLRRLFELACRYSGQVLSYTKMLGQLHDAGNATTLAHYLDLLGGAGMVAGLPKFAGESVRQRGSSPKLQVLNTALLTSHLAVPFDEARRDRELWGRLVESCAGAHLANAAATGAAELFWWREKDREVDFVLRSGRRIAAIEVKGGRSDARHRGLETFATAYKPNRTLLVGPDGLPLEKFLLETAEHWLQA